jgi:hypothetical protein
MVADVDVEEVSEDNGLEDIHASVGSSALAVGKYRRRISSGVPSSGPGPSSCTDCRDGSEAARGVEGCEPRGITESSIPEVGGRRPIGPLFGDDGCDSYV